MLNSIQSIASINFATTNPLARAGQFLLYPCQQLWVTHHVTLVAKAGQNRYDYARSHVMTTAEAPKWLQLCAMILLFIPTVIGVGLIKAAAACDEDFRIRLQWARELIKGTSLFKVEMLDDALEEYFDVATPSDAAKAKHLLALMEFYPKDLKPCFARFSQEKQKIDLLLKECTNPKMADCLKYEDEESDPDLSSDMLEKLKKFRKLQKEAEQASYILRLYDCRSKAARRPVLLKGEIDDIAHKLNLPYAAQWMHFVPAEHPAIQVVAERILNNMDAFLEEFEWMVLPWFFDWMHSGSYDALLNKILTHIDGKCQHSPKHAEVLHGLCYSLNNATNEAATSNFLSMWKKAHFLDALTLNFKLHWKSAAILEYFLTHLKPLQVTPEEVTKVLKHVKMYPYYGPFVDAISRAPWATIQEFFAIQKVSLVENLAKEYPMISEDIFEKIFEQGLKKSYLVSQAQVEWLQTLINCDMDLKSFVKELEEYYKLIKSIMFHDAESFNKVYCYILTQSERNVIQTWIHVDPVRYPAVVNTVPTLKQIILSKLHAIHQLAPQHPRLPLDLEEELNPTL